LIAEILPLLKRRDAERLQALVDAKWLRKTAAESLELDLVTFNRRMRQTMTKNIRKAVREIVADDQFSRSLDLRSDDGEEEIDDGNPAKTVPTSVAIGFAFSDSGHQPGNP